MVSVIASALFGAVVAVTTAIWIMGVRDLVVGDAGSLAPWEVIVVLAFVGALAGATLKALSTLL